MTTQHQTSAWSQLLRATIDVANRTCGPESTRRALGQLTCAPTQAEYPALEAEAPPLALAPLHGRWADMSDED